MTHAALGKPGLSPLTGIVVIVVIVAALAGVQRLTLPRAGRAPVASSGVCADVAAAGQTISDLQGILRTVDVSDSAGLAQAEGGVDRLLTAYGARGGLPATQVLRTEVAGALAAAADMLRDFGRGDAGEVNGALTQRLLAGAGAEVARLKQTDGCP